MFPYRNIVINLKKLLGRKHFHFSTDSDNIFSIKRVIKGGIKEGQIKKLKCGLQQEFCKIIPRKVKHEAFITIAKGDKKFLVGNFQFCGKEK
jgi:hypothetical protein